MEELLPTSVDGLPLHPLVVHAVVVLLPLTSLLVMATALIPRVRAWAGWLPVAMAAASVALVPVATGSGRNLQAALNAPAGSEVARLIEEHAAYGRNLLWFALGLLAVAAASYAAHRRGNVPRVIAGPLLVAGVLVPVAAITWTVLAGQSGARTVWGSVPTEPPSSAPPAPSG